MAEFTLLKVCSKCNIEKPISEFYKRKESKDGFRDDCKECVKLRVRKYGADHKKKAAEYSKKYRVDNREALRIKKKEYYKKNKGKINQKNTKWKEANKDRHTWLVKRWYEKNKKLCNERSIAWNDDNKERRSRTNRLLYVQNKDVIKKKVRLYYKENKSEIAKKTKEYNQTDAGKNVIKKRNHKRRALEFNAKIEDFNPLDVFKRDAYVCQLCGKKTRPDFKNSNHPLYPNLDHIIPLSKGGEHSRRNTQCLCHQCNMKKHNTGMGDQLRMFG